MGKKIGGAALWIVQILAALAFVAIGFGKFHSPFWIKAFLGWGYSDEFRMLIGGLEMMAGVLLAVPRATLYAGALIDVIMIGAAGTLLANAARPAQLFAPIFWMTIVSSVAYARRRSAWRPGGARIAAGDPV